MTSYHHNHNHNKPRRVLPLSRFTRKFNAQRIRYERWNKIVHMLSEFEGLINNYDHASPDEVRALKEIHRKLYECQKAAKHFEEELRPYERILR